MYSVDDLKAVLDAETFAPEQLELLCLVANGYSDDDIANEKEITANAVRKRMGNIYSKLGIEGGRGKLKKLNGFLEEKLNPATKKRKIILAYFSEDERELALTLANKFLAGPEIDFLLIEYHISLGKKWKEKLEENLRSTDVGIACFLHETLASPLASSVIGFLSGKLSLFRFVYFGGVKPPEELVLFEGINGGSLVELVKLRELLYGKSSVDPNSWVKYHFETEKWEHNIAETIKSSRLSMLKDVREKFSSSDELLKQISSLLDEKSYKYEHEIIEGIINKLFGYLSGWLPEISAQLVKKMDDFREKLSIELINHNINIISVESPSQKIKSERVNEIVENWFSLPEDEDFNIDVGVLRLIQDDNSFKQVSSGGTDGIEFNSRDISDRMPGHGFVQMVRAAEKPIVVRFIDYKLIDSFRNRDWINNNELKSFMCFPIFSGGEISGVFSMYSKDRYAIYEHYRHFYFVECYMYLLSRIVTKFNRMKALSTFLSLSKEHISVGNLGSLDDLPKPSYEGIEDLKHRCFSQG